MQKQSTGQFRAAYCTRCGHPIEQTPRCNRIHKVGNVYSLLFCPFSLDRHAQTDCTIERRMVKLKSLEVQRIPNVAHYTSSRVHKHESNESDLTSRICFLCGHNELNLELNSIYSRILSLSQRTCFVVFGPVPLNAPLTSRSAQAEASREVRVIGAPHASPQRCCSVFGRLRHAT